MKYFTRLKEIKKTEGEIREIKNFLSPKEVKLILKYTKNNTNYLVNRNDGWKISFNKIKKRPARAINSWHPIIKNIICPKLKKIFPAILIKL